MPTVSVSFTALPEHVRTARLVAAAVARRMGMVEDDVDAVRLAVGEACVRAVTRSRAAGTLEPVRVELTDDDGTLAVAVRDHVPATQADDVERLSLALVRGLAGTMDLAEEPAGGGSVLRLVWSI